MPGARVLTVTPNSSAAVAGIAVGDEIISVNGESLTDVIHYQIATDGSTLELEIRSGGLERLLEITKGVGEPLGITLDNPVFDRIRTCDNHCPFCFIYQLPEGSRSSLKIKDDDYRLSFLYGNFTTLTRFTEVDLERVITERLSPLNVSIHATDPEVRAELLRNARGVSSLRWLSELLAADIEIHGQIVVCPGINDGLVLEETLCTLLDRYPKLASVGIVPLGVSAHNREPSMRPHLPDESTAVLETITRWQEIALRELGRRFVFASDEYFVMNKAPIPPLTDYEGAPQYENGIGMAATLFAEIDAYSAATDRSTEPVAVPETSSRHGGFFQSVDGAPHFQYRPGPSARKVDEQREEQTSLPIRILTGEYGASVLHQRIETLTTQAKTHLEIVPVPNTYFGGTTAVTGLLAGADVAEALLRYDTPGRWLLPDVVLTNDRFLDDVAVEALPKPVELIAANGTALMEALAS